MKEFNKISLRMVCEKAYEYNDTVIRSTLDAVDFINQQEDIANDAEENVYCIAMNNKNQIISFSQIAKGGTDLCNFDTKTLFKTILLCNANKFILVHNHPSGDCTPSETDYKTTKRIQDASNLLGLTLLDHIVVAQNGYASCRNNKEVR